MRTAVVAGWWLTGLAIAMAVVLLGWAWAPAFDAPYQYDDTVTPQKDPASQSLTNWAQSLPRTLRPLTKLSYATESSVGATSAPVRRVFNGVLFLAATALLARLAVCAGLLPGLSVALATLWAAHPVHAETIVALAGRAVLVSLTLCLASALCLLRERRLAAVALALLAVLARETALPWFVVCVALIVEPNISKRGSWAALLGALALGTSVVFASPRMRQLVMFSWRDPAAGDRLGLQWAALPRELVLWLLEPDAFTVDIDFAPHGAERLSYLLGAAALYGAFGWLALRSRTKLVRVAALLWLCLVLPLHSVVPKLDPLTARSVSAHSAALVLLAAAVLGRALQRDARLVYAAWGVLAVALVFVVPITRERAALYRDPIALWRDAAERSRRSTRPLVNLGTLLAQKGQLPAAREALLEAIRRNPHSSDARERLAGVEVMIETQRLLTDPAGRGNSSTP